MSLSFANPIASAEDPRWSTLLENLRKSESLAAAGQFAASIMHEINNPLEAITNLIFLLQQNPGNSELVQQYTQLIEEQLGALIRIAHQTLSFYRVSPQKTSVSAAALAEAALRIHQKIIAAKHIQVLKRLPPEISIDVHPGEMLQVISNLVSNAVDASPENGVLYLRCRCSPRAVEIVVADTGHGIPGSIVHRIFDPFFTTKQEKGSGLGLAISKAIVEKHQGSVRARSTTRSGRSGSAFRISLPPPAKIA